MIFKISLSASSAQNKVYYLSLRVSNTGSLAKETVLKYQGPQGPEELEVLPGQTVTKEVVFTTNIQPATVEVKGFEKSTNTPVKLNGQDSILVNPLLTKVMTEISITSQGKGALILFHIFL